MSRTGAVVHRAEMRSRKRTDRNMTDRNMTVVVGAEEIAGRMTGLTTEDDNNRKADMNDENGKVDGRDEKQKVDEEIADDENDS